MNKTIVVAPNAGFCNRLRTMVSSIYLSERLDMQIQHLWIGTVYKCANKNIQEVHDKSFEHYFKERIQRCDYRKMKNEIHIVYTEWLPTNNPRAWFNFQSYGQKLLEITDCRDLSLIQEGMNSTESFLIESSYIKNISITKKEKTRIYQNYFNPRDYLLQEIKPYLTKNLIGICIRRTDFLIYFPETQIADDIILKWINTLNDNIYFCSDDKDYEAIMRKKIKNAIDPEFNSTDYDFLTFLLLSTCVRIYGTYKSSFSEEASYFGGIDYVPLTHDFFSS